MKRFYEVFNVTIAALIAAILLIASARAAECQPNQARIIVGLDDGQRGPQAVNFCRDDPGKGVIIGYDIGDVPRFEGCLVVELINLRLLCGDKTIAEDAGVRRDQKTLYVAFSRDGSTGPKWRAAYELAEAVAKQ